MATKDLDFAQVIKQVYDPATESLQTVPGGATSFEIELDADDGDSVEVRGIEVRNNNALAVDVDVSKMKRVAVWVEGGAGNYTVTANVGTATLVLGTVATGTGDTFDVLADLVEVTGAGGATVTVIGSGN